MTRNLTVLLLIILAGIINSQTKISGKITDENNSPLPGANIYLKDTYDGVSSSADGSFSFVTDEEGESILIVSYIGYKEYQKVLLLNTKEIIIDVILEEDAKELGTVVISAGSFEASDENKGVILRPLDVVTTGSDADIYSALETLPGTQQIGETEGLFVRGGSSSETVTIIDEMVVQNPFYSSVPDIPARGRFSPFLFKGTVFSTGGYSAQYGQALSSALILKTQDLPPQTLSSISLMAIGFGGAHVQRWENTSISFEATYANLNPYFKIQKQRTDWEKAPVGIDASINLRHKFSKTGMLKFFTSFSTGDLSLYNINLDSISAREFFGMKDKNYYLNTNFREILGDDWTIFGGFSYSNDGRKIELSKDNVDQDEQLLQGKVIISKNIFSNSFLTFGGEIQKSKFDNTFNQVTGSISELYSAGFLESDIFFSNDIALRLGLRGEYSKLIKKANLAPRISLAYRLGTFDQLNFAYGIFYQTPHKDYLFFTNNFKFENAVHYIFNYQYVGLNRTFRIEFYYKDYNNLAKGSVYTYPYFNLPVVPFNNGGKGYAKGVDIFWRDRETITYTDYWISYSYLDTKRDFKNYPGLAFPTFATPHTFSVVLKHWVQSITTSFGLTYTFATGRPYFNPNNTEFLGDRGKNYNNLSLNMSFLTSLFNNFTVIFFSIDNIPGFNNIFGYRYSTDGSIKSPVLPPALRTAFIGLFISIGEPSPF
jgi:hypothetical protein